jgi:hypothetical protein
MFMKRVLLLAAGALVISAVNASAQASSGMQAWEDRGFFNINFGLQSGSREFDEGVGFTIYDEPSFFEGTHQVDGGGMFDIGGGIRVWRNLAAGLSFNRFTDSDDINLRGSVPHPIFFNRPREATAAVGALDHEETAVHIQATWVQPLADRISVSFSFGPSFFSVKQDVVVGVDVSEQGAPFNAVNAAARAVEVEESGVGFNIGADITYMATTNVGGGFFLRYSAASVDLERGPLGTFSLDVGGFQAGGGLRVRF